jgi:hypothetical protein
MAREEWDLSQISVFGLISESRVSKNQSLTASKTLSNRNLRQIPPTASSRPRGRVALMGPVCR